MFKRKKEETSNLYGKINTIIGEGTVCEGIIKTAGSLRLDGDFKGEIGVQGDLVVGENAAVEATIVAKNIYVGGYVQGNIQTEGKVDLTSSGAFLGDMLVGHLNVEEGALFKGNCQMHDAKKKEEPVVVVEEVAATEA